jgi:hypothetical protein
MNTALQLLQVGLILLMDGLRDFFAAIANDKFSMTNSQSPPTKIENRPLRIGHLKLGKIR